MVRILIADPHDVVRTGVRKIVETQSNWEVVAVAVDGHDAIQKAIETEPDVAVIAYALPLVDGIGVTHQIRAKLPKTEVLIFTVHYEEIVISQLLEAGARGYLLKSDASQKLIAAIEALASHQPFFTGKVSEALLDLFVAEQSTEETLTRRERQILQLIAEGHTNRTAAGVLGVSLKTVETHRDKIMKKLNLHSTAALVRYAVRNKIVEP